MVTAMVGLRCQGSEHAWMAPDLTWVGWRYRKSSVFPGRSDRPSRAVESLSRVPTDDERILPMVFSGLAVNA
jgi:hypothetical protein